MHRADGAPAVVALSMRQREEIPPPTSHRHLKKYVAERVGAAINIDKHRVVVTDIAVSARGRDKEGRGEAQRGQRLGLSSRHCVQKQTLGDISMGPCRRA
jgi:hypothetical protein